MSSGLLLRDRIERLYIIDKKIQTIPLRLNWAQLHMLSVVEEQLRTTGKIRIIVLKARQLGISTFTEALAFTMAFAISNYRVLITTHEREASEGILAMTKLMWNMYDFNQLYTPKSDSKFESSWIETGSGIKIATAGAKGAAGVGRSKTTHFQHISELAFWPDPETAMLSLNQTLPEEPLTASILESTANGIGNYFHTEWTEAEAGKTQLQPLFYPWWKHPGYRASYNNMPVYKINHPDPIEALYRQRFNLDDDQLCWRRWMIANKCHGDPVTFMQEYPATPEEAFITSGKNIFPLDQLRHVFYEQRGRKGRLEREGDLPKWVEDAEGPLTVFKAPDRNLERGMYVLGGDATRTTNGDYACAQVINRRTLEQVAVWRGKVDATTFGEEVFKLGLWYNTALVNNESEGGGYATTGTLVGMGYPNLAKQESPDSTRGRNSSSKFGWNTTTKAKHLAIGWAKKLIANQDVKIHHLETFNEMKNYVTYEDGTMGPADKKKGHDDTVMAYCIAIVTHYLDGVLEPYMGASPLYDTQLTTTDQSVLEGNLHDAEPDHMSWPTKYSEGIQ